MSEKRRFLDVWIVEGNTVYKEVPFDVVADWVQQGRLLEDDMARPSGTSEWARLGDMADFAVYVPEAGRAGGRGREPSRADGAGGDRLFVETAARRRRHRSRYDPVDRRESRAADRLHAAHDQSGRRRLARSRRRRPCTARSSTPRIPSGSASTSRARTTPRSSTRSASAIRPAAEGDRDLPTRAALLDRLKALLANRDAVDLTINANPAVRSGDVRQLTVELEQEPFRSKIARKYTGVSDKQP